MMRPIVSWKTWLSGVFFCFYVALQVAVPLRGLYRDGPSQFCWFMYSGRGQRIEFVLHFKDGRTAPLLRDRELRRKARLLRADADQARFVPPHLCATDSSLRQVIIRQVSGGGSTEYLCAP